MYDCIYDCMYDCMYVYMYECMYICVCMPIYMYVSDTSFSNYYSVGDSLGMVVLGYDTTLPVTIDE